jgi:hypothetical protein
MSRPPKRYRTHPAVHVTREGSTAAGQNHARKEQSGTTATSDGFYESMSSSQPNKKHELYDSHEPQTRVGGERGERVWDVSGWGEEGGREMLLQETGCGT